MHDAQEGFRRYEVERCFAYWLKTDTGFSFKSNHSGAYDQILVLRDLEYRRDLKTSNHTIELTRQLVVHKPLREYLLWIDRIWLNLKRVNDSHAFFLFVEVVVRDYMRKSAQKHSNEYINDFVAGLVKGFVRKSKPLNARMRFFDLLAHQESLLYLREREKTLGYSFLPLDLFNNYLAKVTNRVDALRRFESSDPILTESRPCTCHVTRH